MLFINLLVSVVVLDRAVVALDHAVWHLATPPFTFKWFSPGGQPMKHRSSDGQFRHAPVSMPFPVISYNGLVPTGELKSVCPQ